MKRLLIFLLLAILFVPKTEAVIFNEIMYDLPGSDTGREWIEIYNNENESVNLTGWKLYEAGTNHGFTLINGSSTLNARSFAVIADNSGDFIFDNPSFNGTLFDSSFSLSNTNETLEIRNSSLFTVQNFTYLSIWGGAGDNNSIQFNETDWCAGIPTPGMQNNCSQILNQTSQNQTQTNQSNNNQSNVSSFDCSGFQDIKILSSPRNMGFGSSGEFSVDFNASCYKFDSAKFLVYGSSSRIVSDSSGEKIISFASCQNGITFGGIEKKSYKIKIPFFIYPNCDKKYEDGSYPVSLRACDSSGKKYYEEQTIVSLSGRPLSCNSGSGQSASITSNTASSTKSSSSKSSKKSSSSSSNSFTGNSARNIKENNGNVSKKEAVFESKSSESKTVAVYMVALFSLMLATYFLVNRGK